jgi:hypothetical protein
MKTRILLAMCVFSLIFIGCESDDTPDIIINDNSVTNNNQGDTNNGGNTNETIELAGSITSDLTLDANQNYLVSSALFVEDGVTLTIPAGTTVRFSPSGVNNFLAVKQGGRIEVLGTAQNPVVMTSNNFNAGPGDWGGLLLMGKAPTNITPDNSENTANSEVGNLPYGGNNPNDSSGTISYLRLEYTGGAINGNAELNGLSLYAVGDGTNIDHVQIYLGSDDGVEFFGGTVNCSFISVVGSEDDSIDWTEGYTGTLTDVYVEQIIDGDSGFEMDGFNTDFSNESQSGVVSLPTVTNVTFIGNNDNSRAFRLRAGTGGIFSNVSINNTGRGIAVEDDEADWITSSNIPTGLQFTDVSFNNVETPFLYSGDASPAPTQADVVGGSAANATGTDYATWGAGWTRQ